MDGTSLRAYACRCTQCAMLHHTDASERQCTTPPVQQLNSCLPATRLSLQPLSSRARAASPGCGSQHHTHAHRLVPVPDNTNPVPPTSSCSLPSHRLPSSQQTEVAAPHQARFVSKRADIIGIINHPCHTAARWHLPPPRQRGASSALTPCPCATRAPRAWRAGAACTSGCRRPTA